MQRYEHGGDIYGESGIRLDFSVSTNPLGLPTAVKEALASHIPDYAHYPDPSCRALRWALAARQGLSPDMVLCGNGASELILALCASLRPRAMLTLAPTFSEYERAALLFGNAMRQHILRPETGFALTEQILATLTPGTGLLFLCNPNNPTGRLAEPPLLGKIIAACGENRTLLVLDECFIDLSQGSSLLPQLKNHPHLLILQAFTKTYAMAGLRLGQLYCGDTVLLARVAAFCPTWSVSAPAQAAGLAALGETDWLEQSRQLVVRERAFMSAGLAALGLTVYPSDANFLLVKSPRPLATPLRAHGILIRDCANFTGLDGCYSRIGLKTRVENQALLSAMEEVVHG